MLKHLKIFILCALFLNFNTIMAAVGDDVAQGLGPFDFPSESFLHLPTEKERVDFQINRYHTLYENNPMPQINPSIVEFDPSQLPVIPGYIPIALDGINYVRAHYQALEVTRIARLLRMEGEEKIAHDSEADSDDDTQKIETLTLAEVQTVVDECNALERQLREHCTNGMTPLQFIVFNFALANTQNITNNKTEGRIAHLNTPQFPFYAIPENVDMPMLLRQCGFISYAVFKPYIIYTPNGSFSIPRIMSNIFEHQISLQGFIIGKFSKAEGPHYNIFLTSRDFLFHDFGHASIVEGMLKTWQFRCFKSLVTNGLDLNQPIIRYIAFDIIHEGQDAEGEYGIIVDKKARSSLLSLVNLDKNAQQIWSTAMQEQRTSVFAHLNVLLSEIRSSENKRNSYSKPFAELTSSETKEEGKRVIGNMIDALFNDANFGNLPIAKEDREFRKNIFTASLETTFNDIFCKTAKLHDNTYSVSFKKFLELKIRNRAEELITPLMLEAAEGDLLRHHPEEP